jgi:dihydroorotate dehydrogenase
MYGFIRFFLFFLDAERAHYTALLLFRVLLRVPFLKQIMSSYFAPSQSNSPVEAFGLTFKNPVGLAAGFDKNGDYMEIMSVLGFGFIEVGTITPRPQLGNPKPRLFRLKQDRAIINRMGFNNKGVDYLAGKLETDKPPGVIVGGNIGKNKDTPQEEAYKDYLICFQKLYDLVDYFAVNVSSPNTPGLRDLQEKEPLRRILDPLLAERETRSVFRPILLKIAPDLSENQLQDIVELVMELPVDGIIATNTTLSRSGLKSSSALLENIGPGGLSGDPVFNKSTDFCERIRHLSNQSIPIIGVGGISTPQMAMQKFAAGASLVQLYSGMIYAGPALIRKILKALRNAPSK